MEPTSSANLDRFLAAYEEAGEYLLTFAVMDLEASAPSSPTWKKGSFLSIRELNVINAWQVGPNTIEAVAIQAGDDPIIPKGVEAPPVRELLKAGN